MPSDRPTVVLCAPCTTCALVRIKPLGSYSTPEPSPWSVRTVTTAGPTDWATAATVPGAAWGAAYTVALDVVARAGARLWPAEKATTPTKTRRATPPSSFEKELVRMHRL